MNSEYDIVPSVIVPVLSKHRVSTLANISIEYKSWTKHLFLARVKTPTERVTDVSKNIPAGIIETILPTNLVTGGSNLNALGSAKNSQKFFNHPSWKPIASASPVANTPTSEEVIEPPNSIGLPPAFAENAPFNVCIFASFVPIHQQ